MNWLFNDMCLEISCVEWCIDEIDKKFDENKSVVVNNLDKNECLVVVFEIESFVYEKLEFFIFIDGFFIELEYLDIGIL